MNSMLVQEFVKAIKMDLNVDLSDYAEGSLERRITQVFFKLNLKSINQMRQKLALGQIKGNDILNEITVNTTEFFRDPTIWADLKTVIVNHLAKQTEIKIWHAGCSTGEEVYSMAILLAELDLIERCKITASDLNDKVVKDAQKGSYHKRFLADMYNNYEKAFDSVDLTSYYELEGPNFIMNENLKRYITFKITNLITLEPFNKFDLILCRNVVIYFNKDLQNRCLSLFNQSLFSNGFLLIGSSESIDFLDDTDKFQTINYSSNIFQKKPPVI
jgi:chemotaxis protein methyltransferase CheR